MSQNNTLSLSLRTISFFRLFAVALVLVSNLAPVTPAPALANDAMSDLSTQVPAAPTLDATKSDALLTDGDGDGRADPGDALRYTVAVSNTGTTDATGLVVSDTLDANTRLVAGSVRVSPLAFPENYVTLRDTALSIAAPGLLTNDTGTPAPTVVPFSGSTTAGGNVSVSANGSFSYTPLAGFVGTDSFTYTATNSVGNDSSVVTVVVEAAPTVVSTSPASNATAVPANSLITITFSEPVNVTASAFAIECPPGTPVAFTNTTGSGPATTFTLDPASDLPLTVVCTVTVLANQVTDADTNDPPDTMAANYVFSFTTTDAVPTVVSTAPVSGTTGVPFNSNITVTFSEPVNVTASAFAIECPTGTPVAFTNTTGSGPATSFTLDPTSDLPENVTCTIKVVAAQVSDVDTVDPPDTMGADYSFAFVTESSPSVSATAPGNTATNVGIDSTITITFSEQVNVTASAFTIECPTGTPVAFTNTTGSGPATSFTLDPTSSLPEGMTCSITVTASQVTDDDLNDPPDQMLADYTFMFTTDTAPGVSASTPSNAATGVAVDTNLIVTFSEAVIVTNTTFAVECPSGSAVVFANTTGNGPASSFTLDPSKDLPANVVCTVTVVAAEVSDADTGDPPDHMAANYIFSFTTDAAPSVTTTTPADTATGIAVDSNIVVDFSETVNVSSNAFRVECPSGTPVAFMNTTGSGPATSFTLDPTSDLPDGVTCTVTVVAAEVSDADAADPPDTMAADYVFSFATDAAPTVTTTSPANAATGVAVNSDLTITFSEPVHVTGSAFAVECPTGTPVAFTNTTGSGPATGFTLTPTSNLPIGTACTVTVVAAQVTDADTSDPPDTMAANYVWSFTTADTAPTVSSTTPTNGATGVATNATITVNFSEPVNVTTGAFTVECPSGTPITFSNTTGNGPATSFMLTPSSLLPEGTTCTVTVVAADVTDNDTVDPPDQMAADYSFSFTTDSAPTVATTTPTNGATNVQINTTIDVTFSESVNATTSSFTLSCGGPALSFGLSASPASSFTLTPAANLPVNTLCTVTVVAAQVSDVDSGDPPDTLASDYSFSFTTVNDTAPSVLATTPSNGATGVASNSAVSITFDEQVNVTGSAFTVECPTATPISFNASASPATTFTLTPSSNLPEGTTCTVTVVANQVTDTDAIDPPDTMAANYVFSFTTDAAPTVVSTTPANGATNLATNTNITVTFSEPVNVTGSAFTLECPSGTPVAFTNTTTSPASSFVLDPTSDLPSGATCTVTVAAAQVTDDDASDPPDTMATDYVFSFMTDAAPSVTTTTPTNGATNLATDGNITINFSEPVNVTGSSFTVECPSGTPAAFTNTTTSPASSFVLDPTSDLPSGATCTVTVVAAQVSDDDASDPPDTMAANYVFSFSTDAAPTVSSTTPGNGATGVAATANITINFSESVNYSLSSFTIECPAGTPVAFALGSVSPGTNAVLDPTSDLPAGVVCTVTVLAAGITDVDANDPPDTMASNYVFSFTVPPVANDDTYAPQIIGNVGVNTATSSGFSVLTNDAGPGITITAFDTTSAQGGSVTLNTSTGTFQYVPAPGYEGPDSFTYTINNAAGSDTGTVNVTVAGMVWFVNNNAATNGNGRLATPFNSLANFVAGAADDPGDTIFLYEGASAYSGPITLLNNQRLIGQDATATLDSIAGLTPPADSFVLPTMNSANGTFATITSAGNGINLGSDNTLRGLTVGDTGGDDISGTSFGTLSVTDMTLNGTGRALNLDTGTLNATFNAVTSTSGINNVNLAGIAGSLTMNGGALSGATGTAFNVSGGNGSITYNGTVSKTNAGRLVDIQSRTGGSTTLAGNMSCTVSCAGINVATNSSGTITFSGATKTLNTGTSAAVTLSANGSTTITFSGGGLAITTTSGAGFSATGGGTVAVTGLANTVASTTGTALNISSATIGASGMTFASIAANGATNGIVLNTTGSSGGLTVTGDGGASANGSGGTIQNTTGPAILLSTTSSVSLGYMNIQNSGDDGIQGTNVTNFTLNRSLVSNNGNAAGESGLDFNGLFGNASITNSSVTGSRAHNVLVSNMNGTLSSLTITGSTFSNPLNSAMDGVSVTLPPGSTGTITSITATGNTFTNNTGDGMGVNAEGTSSIGMFNFANNTLNGNDVGVNVSTNGTANVKYDIHDNPTMNGTRQQVNIAANDGVVNNGVGPTMEGFIRNNTITTSPASSVFIALWVVADGDGNITTDISNNTITNFGDSGIDVESRGGSGDVNARIANNSTTTTAATPFTGMFLRSGNATAGETNLLCVNLSGNDINAGIAFTNYELDRFSSPNTLFQIQGLTPSPATGAQAAAYVASTDPGSTAGAVGGVYTNATCATVSFAPLPLLAAGGEGPGAPTALITQAQLDAATATAIAHWAAAGATPAELARLHAATLRVSDLAAGRLGETFGTQVDIDRDAAGWGWADAQAQDGSAHKRIDLLSVVAHELGHVIGRADLHDAAHTQDVMADALPIGARRVPAAAPASVTTTPSSVEVNVGTLPAGKHVIVVFDVVIAATLPNGVNHVANQARIVANGITPLLSDDPATSAASDPTVTLLDVGFRVFLPMVVRGSEQQYPDLVIDQINVTSNTVEVVIRNQGQAAVTTSFWVDVYINPTTPPTAVNQTWPKVGSQGLVWGITTGALPLAPGATRTLTIGDAFYRADLSAFSNPLASGTNVYAQVDSADTTTTYGGVLESHEVVSGPYNNIAGPVTLTSSAQLNAARPASAQPAAQPALPSRPAGGVTR